MSRWNSGAPELIIQTVLTPSLALVGRQEEFIYSRLIPGIEFLHMVLFGWCTEKRGERVSEINVDRSSPEEALAVRTNLIQYNAQHIAEDLQNYEEINLHKG